MKKLLSVLVAVLMVLTCALPAFAEDGEEAPTVVRIPDGTKVVTSDTLDDGVIDRLRVKTIYVPSSVTTIKSGALTGYANVENVYVENSKENITIEDGALPTGTNVVYTEKSSPPPATTTTTKAPEETTTEKADTEEKTTEKADSEDKSTTKKTTAKATTKKNGKTVSKKATTTIPRTRVPVEHRTLTVKSTKKTKTDKGDIPEVQADPDSIIEEPDPNAEEVTTVTFYGEAITDKDGTIIGFEDPQMADQDEASTGNRARAVTLTAVGVVGLSAAVLVFFKLRRRP